MEYQILNLIEINSGILNTIESFIVHDEQLKQEIVDRAEEVFINRIQKLENRDLDYGEADIYIEEGYSNNFIDIHLLWSYSQ